MMVVLSIGFLAALAAVVGLVLIRRKSASPLAKVTSKQDPKHREMTDLFVARLKSGSIGVPDLVRLFRNEGKSPEAIAKALADAMSKFPQFASRKDKFETWLREGERKV